MNRKPRLPSAGRAIAAAVSKADLAEALWDAAALMNETGADEDDETLESIIGLLPEPARVKARRALVAHERVTRIRGAS